MGWSEISLAGPAEALFRDVRSPREFYFCHSFTLTTPDPSIVAARTEDSAAPLVAAIMHGTVFATQFHPEKSQIKGLRLLEAFLDWTP
jgi:glutamine amidotransferase